MPLTKSNNNPIDKYTMTNALKANIEKFIHNISANMLVDVYINLKFKVFLEIFTKSHGIYR